MEKKDETVEEKKYYTISEAAGRMGMTASALRYYDSMGLLPFVEKTASGQRMFQESDFEWLCVLDCLKNTGMQIRDIKQYSDWCREGDATLQKRLDLFLRQREQVLEQIEKLNQSLDRIDYKIWHYRTSVEAGTERCGVGKDQDSYEKWKAEKENQ